MRARPIVLGLAMVLAALGPNPIFGPQVRAALFATHTPVYLPSWIPPFDGDAKRLYASAEVSPVRYTVRVDPVPNCHGATACSFLEISGGPPTHGMLHGRMIRLANGTPAFYAPVACGASCGPEQLVWVYHGVLYSIALRDSRGETILRVANSMVPVAE